MPTCRQLTGLNSGNQLVLPKIIKEGGIVGTEKDNFVSDGEIRN